MKARIVERTRPDGQRNYIIQQRFLFWWFDSEECGSLDQVKKKLCFYDGTKAKDRIVDVEKNRTSDPQTKVMTDKLYGMLKSKLSEPKCPTDYIEGLAPHVKEESEEDIKDAVNEAVGKVFVVDHPAHGRKVLIIDEDFAQRVLALGSLPC